MAKSQLLFLTQAVMYDGAILHAGTEVTARCDAGTVDSLQQRGMLSTEAPRVAASSKVVKVKSGAKKSSSADDETQTAREPTAEDPSFGSAPSEPGREVSEAPSSSKPRRSKGSK